MQVVNVERMWDGGLQSERASFLVYINSLIHALSAFHEVEFA